ncbi:MAG: glycosyltransferase family 39 protein, partial [Candidatus Tectimicrobiota bacterium]
MKDAVMEQAFQEQPGRWHGWLVAGLLVLALGLRAGALDKSFGGDETARLHGAQLPLSALFEYLPTEETHPPLIYILLHGWLKVRSGEVWIRLFFVGFGMALCGLAYGVGRSVGGAKVGMLTLALVAVAPGLVWASQYVGPYGPAFTFLTLALLSAVKLVEDARSMRWWIAYALAAVAGLYSFYMSALVLATLGVGLLLVREVRLARWRTWLAVHVGITMAFLPGLWLI